ncbi:MAG TPA: IS5/IS1182 family transposase, partial [Acetobacteraceae bacterium]
MTIRRFKTGECREQGSLLPARVDDYVGPDNPVRVIAAYVGTLDVAALGF